MRRLFPALRASAAAALLFAATACLADRPALADDALASLQSAYAGAVTPGEQADLYRELLATVLLRVQRSYATEVDLDALAAAAAEVVKGLPPGTADPRERQSRRSAARSRDDGAAGLPLRECPIWEK
jgi:hypothetical protein